eukprot:CAMPEP_0113938178 /NCGR_PEP_ID=MMETSP1339-20121228/4591_1 /TAXON_ID=94617 /ORGANISM="Fibrocapsa japonica" /LENGTH=240 /DNA_ID=CAMNT_0000941167 /DNA_START=158 /DNA_END=880 /DNA_ORIENTATION=+ /assembly_acc=CAM_ASM_000762
MAVRKQYPEARARKALLEADAVCFDVDSTVIQEEGIDVLAEYCGAGEKVAELTSRAMGGSMRFQDALAARLDLIRPSKADFLNCLEKQPPKLSPGIKEFIQALHARGTHVYLVSGGFRLMIEPVADKLSIPHSRIYANSVLFDEKEEYTTYNDEELTSRSGGKAAVVNKIRGENDYKSIVVIGDGVTDMEARPPADAFIGYGGVAERAPVKEGADWFIKDFNDLIDQLSSEKAIEDEKAA